MKILRCFQRYKKFFYRKLKFFFQLKSNSYSLKKFFRKNSLIFINDVIKNAFNLFYEEILILLLKNLDKTLNIICCLFNF